MAPPCSAQSDQCVRRGWRPRGKSLQWLPRPGNPGILRPRQRDSPAARADLGIARRLHRNIFSCPSCDGSRALPSGALARGRDPIDKIEAN